MSQFYLLMFKQRHKHNTTKRLAKKLKGKEKYLKSFSRLVIHTHSDNVIVEGISVSRLR